MATTNDTGKLLQLARQASTLPPGWRLWIPTVIVALAAQVSVWMLPGLSAVLLLWVWYNLSRAAGTYDEGVTVKPIRREGLRPPRGQHLAAFIAGLLLSMGLLLATLVGLQYVLEKYEVAHDDIIVIEALTVTMLLVAMGIVVVRNWWRPSYAIIATLGVIGMVILALIFSKVTPLIPEDEVRDWLRSFLRLSLLLLMVDLAQQFIQRRLFRRSGLRKLLQYLPTSLTMSALLALVVLRPGHVTSLQDSWIWLTLIILLTAGILAWQWYGRLALWHDTARYRRHCVSEWEDLGFTNDLFMSLAVLPPIILTPTANWLNWLLSLLVSVATMMLWHSSRRGGQPRAVAPSPKSKEAVANVAKAALGSDTGPVI